MVSRSRSSPMVAAPSPGAEEAWDEMLDGRGEARPVWRELALKLQALRPDERAGLSATAGRMLEDLGTAFNVYNDVAGGARPYQLDPLPLMISRAEWEKVSEGLAQRQRLLELVVADLYGPRRLLEEGLVPPDLIHSNPVFLPQTTGVPPVGGKFLVTTATDLVRTPDGQWMVLRDQTRGPGGLGQVLQNRNVTANLLSETFHATPVRRLGPFFELERSGLQTFCGSRVELPNVVVLTPGFRDPSYFEHAYKARLLGFPLVEPADLTVRERRLYLKTLSGLRRIDGVVCRVDDDGLDPLEFWTLGGGGVPGLMEVWRSGNVAMANAPGAGFASSPALLPFLPRICRKWLGEELKIPFVETWWLGQEEVRRQVVEQLHRYVLMPAFRPEPLLPVRGSALSPVARRQWAAAIERNPHDFVVQRDFAAGHAPALEGRSLVSRPLVWRAFVLNGEEGPVALPGGLARVGKSGMTPQLWPWHSGYTKDVWVEAEPGGRRGQPAERSPDRGVRKHPSATEVPSRIAEQLFWVGRYAERIEMATRLLRVTLRHMMGESGGRQREQLAACLALIDGSGLLPENEKMRTVDLLGSLSSLVYDGSASNGLVPLVHFLQSNAAAARDRLSDDTWRLFNRLEGILQAPERASKASGLLHTLDTLILHLAALAGMEAENMTRGQGWRFLETGRRIERAIGTLQLLGTALVFGDGETPALEPVLETCDSVMTYRRRHFSRPRWEGVCELLFHDRLNPRSVAFQVAVLDRELARFPGDSNLGVFPKIVEQLGGLDGYFEETVPPGEKELGELGEGFETLSDLLTQHYFSHSVRRVY